MPIRRDDSSKVSIMCRLRTMSRVEMVARLNSEYLFKLRGHVAKREGHGICIAASISGPCSGGYSKITN